MEIPASIKDVSEDWIRSLCQRSTLFEGEALEKLIVRIHPWEDDSQGALSDILRVQCEAADVSSGERMSHWLFIKVMPASMKALILRHRLFEREIVMYRDVFPLMMQKVIKDRLPDFEFKHFLLPKYVYGAVEKGNGVLVLEDLSASGFKIGDSALKLLNNDKLGMACSALAEFHALSMAFDVLSTERLVDIFPILDPKNLIWFQDDMIPFIDTMNVISKIFLRNIPSEKDTSRRFEAAMMNPMHIFQEEIRRKGSFNCLQHGDSWHNNFLFQKDSSKSCIIDWQLSYYGNGLSDLSYLIYSSSSKLTRLESPNFLVHSYLNVLSSTLKDLELLSTQHHSSLGTEEFIGEFKKSLPLTLLLCGNIEDLTLREFEDEEHKNENSSKPPRRVSIASDMDMISLHTAVSPEAPRVLDPRKARSMRRKHYLEICKDILR